MPAEAIPLIAPLLNLPLPPEYPPSTLSPEQQRRRLLATLVEWVLGSARAQPLVIAIEDLHWADPSTLELIQLLVEQGATARLLLLYTARPEFRAPWPMRAHHTQITLNRLSARDIRTMVAQVAASKALSDETVATVVERTGGVPLFVEELTRAVLESGDAKLTGREIPATLHDSLMARLDRLGPAKEVAQIGAVIGREFSYELLHAVHPIAEEDLQAALAQAGRCGIAVRARHRARRDLSVQARADSGCGLRGAAQEPPQGAASASSRAPSMRSSLRLRRRIPKSSRAIGPKPAKPSPRSPNGQGPARPPRRAMLSARRRKAISRRWRCSNLCPNRPSATFANWSSASTRSDAHGHERVTSRPRRVEATERARDSGREERQPGPIGRCRSQRICRALLSRATYPPPLCLADQALDLAQREGKSRQPCDAHAMRR